MSRLFDKRMRLAVVQTSAVPSLVRQLSSITDCGFRVFGGIAFVSRGNFPHRGPYEDFAKSWALAWRMILERSGEILSHKKQQVRTWQKI